MREIILVALFLLAALLYFTPSLLSNNKSKTFGVFLLNLLFGWTVIGWFAALIWAISGKSDEQLTLEKNATKLQVEVLTKQLEELKNK
jgi:hypothetical protein